MKIETLKELADVARAGKCVAVPNMSSYHRRPAAWVMSLQGSIILRILESGMYLYVPESAKKAEFSEAVRRQKRAAATETK